LTEADYGDQKEQASLQNRQKQKNTGPIFLRGKQKRRLKTIQNDERGGGKGTRRCQKVVRGCAELLVPSHQKQEVGRRSSNWGNSSKRPDKAKE